MSVIEPDVTGGATTRQVVRSSLNTNTGGLQFDNPDISYVSYGIEVVVKPYPSGDVIDHEKTWGHVIPVRTYALRTGQIYDVFVQNLSRTPIVMQHVYI